VFNRHGGLSGCSTLRSFRGVASDIALAGLGYATFAFFRIVAILAADLLLRPLARRINRTPVQAPEELVLYLVECVCRTSDVGHIRALLLEKIGRTHLLPDALHSEDEERIT
jgi:putative Mg2+ transporter-C (MgtC) family protein